ncbi:UTP11-like, U3 small nucleolar ribonucleoprotein [Rhizina undulata]
MSSLRNAVQRRNHKERSQLTERQKWGHLEKKKDYVLRARDYNLKKAKLSALRSKATTRNPDEFYFAMTSSHTRDGGIRVADRGNEVLSQDAVKLLKTQDAGYLRLQSSSERKKIEKLEKELGFVDADDVKGKHVVFVDKTQDAKNFDAAEHFGTHPELIGRRGNRLRMEQLKEGVVVASERKKRSDAEEEQRRKEAQMEAKKAARAKEMKYKELEARMKREEELKKVERELELQKARMQKAPMAGKNKWAKVRRR